MRKEYALTEEEYVSLQHKKVRAEYNGTIFPVNELSLGWIELGLKYSFDPWTVEPINGSYFKFTAESLDYE